jgi:hypothetical protein
MPGFQVAALLTFGSLDTIFEAAGGRTKEIVADIANFTKAQASIQINELLA